MLAWEDSFETLLRGVRAKEAVPMRRMLLIEAAALATMYFCVPVRHRFIFLVYHSYSALFSDVPPPVCSALHHA